MSTHTPGPWAPFGDEIYGADGTRVAEAVARRDVLLVAAAPELLAALEATRAHWIHTVNAPACLGAIAKARGCTQRPQPTDKGTNHV